MKTNKISLFLAFFLLQIALQAQTNYIEGLIVTTAKDTLKGLVNDKDWDYHPESILFKPTKDAKPVKYFPKDLLLVKSESGRYFEVWTAEINQTSRKELSYDSKPELKEKRVFMHPFIKGELSLYMYQSPDFEKHYFVQKSSEELLELLEVQYKKKVNKVEVKVVEKRYIKQLKKLTYDCNVLDDKLKDLNFRENELIEYVREYNTCKSALEKDFTSMYKRSGTKVEFNIVGGFNSGSINFIESGGSYDFMTLMEFPRSNSVVLGGGINFVLNKWNERWAAGIEILSFEQETGQEVTISHGGDEITYNAQFKNRIRSSNILLRYYLSDRDFRPYIKVGLGRVKARKSTENVVTGTSIHFTKVYEDIEDITFWTNRRIVAGGLNWSKFYVEARYSFGKSVDRNRLFNLKSNEAYLLLGLAL